MFRRKLLSVDDPGVFMNAMFAALADREDEKRQESLAFQKKDRELFVRWLRRNLKLDARTGDLKSYTIKQGKKSGEFITWNDVLGLKIGDMIFFAWRLKYPESHVAVPVDSLGQNKNAHYRIFSLGVAVLAKKTGWITEEDAIYSLADAGKTVKYLQAYWP